jgi:hypothetical protein
MFFINGPLLQENKIALEVQQELRLVETTRLPTILTEELNLLT